MITVIGGGLAGCEAAWQAAMQGVPVTLYEMRPARSTAVHKTDQLAELVENLKAVPAPSRGRSGSSGDVAIVPAAHSAAEELDPEPDEDDE